MDQMRDLLQSVCKTLSMILLVFIPIAYVLESMEFGHTYTATKIVVGYAIVVFVGTLLCNRVSSTALALVIQIALLAPAVVILLGIVWNWIR